MLDLKLFRSRERLTCPRPSRSTDSSSPFPPSSFQFLLFVTCSLSGSARPSTRAGRELLLWRSAKEAGEILPFFAALPPPFPFSPLPSLSLCALLSSSLCTTLQSLLPSTLLSSTLFTHSLHSLLPSGSSDCAADGKSLRSSSGRFGAAAGSGEEATGGGGAREEATGGGEARRRAG
eukprot:264710-Hanusia_phi.AAC.1